MNIAISHLSLNFLGGEERLCLSFIEALKTRGHKVTLFTVEKTEWKSLKKFFGDIVIPDKESYTTSQPIHAKFLTPPTLIFAYTKYLKGLIKLNNKKEHDLVINTYGDLINSLTDVAYVHFPLRATVDYAQTPAFASALKWRIYCQAYKIVVATLDNVRPSIILTNSKFTQQVIREYLNRQASVLSPPVNVQTYADIKAKKRNLVVTISRFTPKRALYRIPLIAKKTREARFIIAGAADEYSIETLQTLRNVIDKQNLKKRVTLMPNISHSKLRKILGQAKAYLHVMPFEHFGISIVEAMAAGCIPIVHRSGGPWLDLLDQQQGKNGFSYTTLEEAAQFIKLIMDNQALNRKMSLAAQKRSWQFDKAVFQKRLNQVLNQLA